MNATEAAGVLAIMAAPHPWDVPDDQAEVWYQAALERCDHELGIEVALRLVETQERFPTPALFNATAAEVTRERWQQERIDHAQGEGRLLDPGEAAPAFVLQQIADIRASLASSDARGHWHGGPGACPVCGGISDRALAKLSPEEQDRVTLVGRQRAARRRADIGPNLP